MLLKDRILEAVPAVLLYLGLNSGFNFYWQYQNLQAVNLGMTMSDILWMSGIVPIICFPATPALGYVGDKLGYKTVLFLCFVGLSGTVIGFLYIPDYRETAKFTILIDSVEDLSRNVTAPIHQFAEYLYSSDECRTVLNFTISQIKCDEDTYTINRQVNISSLTSVRREHCDLHNVDFCVYEIDAAASDTAVYCEASLQNTDSMEETGDKVLLLVLYFILYTLYDCFLPTMFNTVDAIAVKVAERIDVEWALISFFGTVSKITSPLAIGYLMEFFSMTEEEEDCISNKKIKSSDYSIPHYAFAASFVLTTFVLIFSRAEVDRKKSTKIPFTKEMAWVLKPAAVGFYTMMLVRGAIGAVVSGYYSVFLTHDLNLSDKWFGICNAVNGAVDCVQLLGLTFLHKYIGSMPICLAGPLFISLRLVTLSYARVYSEDDIPWEVFISSAFECHVFQWVGVVGYVKVIAPSNLTATALGISSTLAFTFGKGVGYVITSQIADLFETRQLFQVVGYGGVVFTFAYALLYVVWLRKTESPQSFQTEIEDMEEKLKKYDSIKLHDGAADKPKHISGNMKDTTEDLRSKDTDDYHQITHM